MKLLPTIKVALATLLISQMGCAPMLRQPIQTSDARLGANSNAYDELTSLPEPMEPVVVAVYKFRDQTGQYKPSEVGASWSTAVTQGATNILLKSLEESGWFIPIEREGLANLLNERKIIRSSRAAFTAQGESTDQLLPPLLFGGIIIEGGIVSYESNILTGGAGLRYFGTGGSGQYREDRVAIYLRAISTSNGRILKTVHTTKTVLSQKIDAGIFRYVSLKRLLEAEIGFTYNEPSDIAVQEAIDKAVYALIVEGIMDDLWSVRDLNDMNSPAIAQYIKEKEENERTDYLGFVHKPYRSRIRLGASAGGILYDGDYPNGTLRPMGEIGVGFFQNSALSLDVGIGSGQLATRDDFSTIIQYLYLNTRYRVLNHYKYTPYLQAGGGYLLSTASDPFDYGTHFPDESYGYLNVLMGFEYMAAERLGIDAGIGYSWMLNDRVDGIVQGKYHDFFWTFKIGINFYIGNNN